MGESLLGSTPVDPWWVQGSDFATLPSSFPGFEEYLSIFACCIPDRLSRYWWCYSYSLQRIRPVPPLPDVDPAGIHPYSIGIRTRLPLLSIPDGLTFRDIQPLQAKRRLYLALLACQSFEYPDQLLGRLCYAPPSEADAPEVLYSASARTSFRDKEYVLFRLST